MARFNVDGSVTWLPLVQGQGPLIPKHGFHSQADVLIEARRAGDLLGATPMDRVEDVEPNAKTGKVYVNCTKNPKRGKQGKPTKGPGNPRDNNLSGHIIELIPTNGHGANEMAWELLLTAGEDGDYGLMEGSAQFACPDNSCIDPQHRLWISTDGSEGTMGFCDALYAIETTEPFRGFAKRFFSAPQGAEITGPCFHPAGKSLFLSVQHPGTDWTVENAEPRWPDFNEQPPRPSIVQIHKKDGGLIG